MSKPFMVRQGDVLIMSAPKDLDLSQATDVERENGRVVLAHGEVTGHAHAISEKKVWLKAVDVMKRALVVNEPATLRHEEHAPIEIPEGTYIVVRQREYAPDQIRNVAD